MIHQRLVEQLRAKLEPVGFDLVAPLQVGWYNDTVDEAFHLPDFGRASSLAVIVANSKALWPCFIAALAEQPERGRCANPLDDYTRDEIGRVLQDLGTSAEVRYAFEPPPRRIAIQRLAHASGLAHLSATHLCIHKTYGPWIGLRAGIVFDIEGPAQRSESAAPCDCSGGCKTALQQALAGTDWRNWLAVREACTVGQQHRYCQEQIEFHYKTMANCT